MKASTSATLYRATNPDGRRPRWTHEADRLVPPPSFFVLARLPLGSTADRWPRVTRPLVFINCLVRYTHASKSDEPEQLTTGVS